MVPSPSTVMLPWLMTNCCKRVPSAKATCCTGVVSPVGTSMLTSRPSVLMASVPAALMLTALPKPCSVVWPAA